MRRPAALVAAAAFVAAAVPVTAADAGPRHRAGVRLEARSATVKTRHQRGIPAGWRATGWAAAPVAIPAPTAPAPAATPAAAPTPAPGPALPTANPRSVSVGATEFAFTLSQPSVQAGEVRVQLDNTRAQDPHDLLIVREGEVVARFGEQPAGSVSARKVALVAGTYALVCPLPKHEERGMTVRLDVRAG